jgi:hypothetical protein
MDILINNAQDFSSSVTQTEEHINFCQCQDLNGMNDKCISQLCRAATQPLLLFKLTQSV